MPATTVEISPEAKFLINDIKSVSRETDNLIRTDILTMWGYGTESSVIKELIKLRMIEVVDESFYKVRS